MRTFAILLACIAAAGLLAWSVASVIHAVRFHKGKEILTSFRRRLRKNVWLLETSCIFAFFSALILILFRGG